MTRAIELREDHFYVTGRIGDVADVVNYDTAEGWMLKLWDWDGHRFMSLAMEKELVDRHGLPALGEVDELDDYIAEKQVPASEVAELFNTVQVRYLRTTEAHCAESKDGDGRVHTNSDALQDDLGRGNHADAQSGDTACGQKRVLSEKRQGPRRRMG
jgi:hypothetical protein